MALADFVYRLKPESGDVSPHDELGLAGILTGGTITLVDVGGGDYCWQFVGEASATGPTHNVTATGPVGATMAIRFAVTVYGTSNLDFIGWDISTNAYRGVCAGYSTSGNVRGRWRDAVSAKSTATHAVSTTIHTAVIRIDQTSVTNADTTSIWWDDLGPADTPDYVSTPTSQGGVILDHLLLGLTAGTIRIFDWVLWAENLTDADCRDLVTNGIRATLDGGTTPIAFTGTIPTQTFTVGAPTAPDLSGYFSGTETPFTFALDGASTALPSGVTLGTDGVLTWSGSGTPGTTTGVIVQGTDDAANTADSNSFNVVIQASASGVVSKIVQQMLMGR